MIPSDCTYHLTICKKERKSKLPQALVLLI